MVTAQETLVAITCPGILGLGTSHINEWIFASQINQLSQKDIIVRQAPGERDKVDVNVFTCWQAPLQAR